jgi:hypothetical protein
MIQLALGFSICTKKYTKWMNPNEGFIPYFFIKTSLPRHFNVAVNI